jgi:hypothetical protein
VTTLVSNGSSPQQRLDSWKSIARHFGRTCRTVQRWHSEYGLPIHRLGGDKGPIFAYADELDEWMKSRGRPLNNEHPEAPRPMLLPVPLAYEVPVHRSEAFDSSLIPTSGKTRSAELVALAYRMWETLSRSNLDVIARLFREAIDLDPGNAEAFTGLSNSLIAEGLVGIVRAPAAYSSAGAALQRALEFNSEPPETKCAEAWLKMVATRDWSGARKGFDEALKHQPKSSRALLGRAMLHVAEGCQKEASGLLLKATQHNPLNTLANALFCWSEYLAGECSHVLDQIEQARATGQFGLIFDAVEGLASLQVEGPDAHIRRIEALAANSPRQDVLQGALGYAYGMSGQGQKASEILDAMTRFEAHERAHEPYAIALVLIGLSQKHEAVKRLEQSYREGSLWSLGFPSDPILAPLRYDPHFRQFLSKASYPVAENSNPGLGAAD